MFADVSATVSAPMSSRQHSWFHLLALCLFFRNVSSLSAKDRVQRECVSHRLNPLGDISSSISRRNFAKCAAVSSTLIATPLNFPVTTYAATGSLAERLSKRDPAALANSVFNLPPPAQVYPPFMRGSWNVTLKYGGYLFPSQKISRDKLTTDFQIPGFQKCSIATLSDVGKDVVHYTMSIDEGTGMEDRSKTLTTSINDHLGYPAIQEVLYDPRVNPNRLSIIFVQYRTTNAERIELFCNGRESELIRRDDIHSNVFVCSEYVRQVTFGTGSEVGIPRQVGTNYAHFWTWKQPINTGEDEGATTASNAANTLTGNLLTAAYLDPQDYLFFEEPSKPVAVYSHVITAQRL